MMGIREAAADFLAQRRIAVTGVSRTASGHGANVVYRRLRDRGYDVVAVNPNAETVEGDSAYPSLAAIPRGVDAVVIATGADHALETVRQCIQLGIRRVWMHRALGAGSVCAAATVEGREHGLTVIDGGCPLMFDPVADRGHKLIKFVLTPTGRVPRRV